MGNTITTDAQNDSLSGGFLIIEIQRLGETVLPIDLDQYHAMRETSAFSTTSFNVNEVLSDDEDGALFNIESQVEDEYDDGTDKKIECKAEKVPFRDDILTQVEDNDDNEDDEPQNIYSHIDQEEHCEQSSDEESKESDTDICDSSSEKSVLVGAPVLEGACIGRLGGNLVCSLGRQPVCTTGRNLRDCHNGQPIIWLSMINCSPRAVSPVRVRGMASIVPWWMSWDRTMLP